MKPKSNICRCPSCGMLDFYICQERFRQHYTTLVRCQHCHQRVKFRDAVPSMMELRKVENIIPNRRIKSSS